MNIPGTFGWKWMGGDHVLEYDECTEEGDIEIDDEDLICGCKVDHRCPSCGSYLDDLCHFEPHDGELARILSESSLCGENTDEIYVLIRQGGWEIE